jgi:hypothetical protein
MTLHHIDSRFDACQADDGPVYPLFYVCELEAGVSCSKEGWLVFVEDKAGFGSVSLFVDLVQDGEDSDIEIRNVTWGGGKGTGQELFGAIANAAEDFARLDWGGIEEAFRDKAAIDWHRIMGKGYARLLQQMGRAA